MPLVLHDASRCNLSAIAEFLVLLKFYIVRYLIFLCHVCSYG